MPSVEPGGQNFRPKPGMPPFGSPPKLPVAGSTRPAGLPPLPGPPGRPLPPTSSTKSGKPNPILFALVALCALIPLIGLPLASGSKTGPIHFFSFLIGDFVSVIALGIFLWKDNETRSRGRYNDWAISSRTAGVSVVVFAWFLGGLHIFFLTLEWSRNWK